MGGFTLEQVVGHPDFQAMALPDKNSFLMENVPEFKAGAPKDRAELLDKIHYGAPATGHEGEAPDKGFLAGAGEAIGDVGKSWLDYAKTPIPGTHIPGGLAVPGVGEYTGVKSLLAPQWPLIKRSAQETWQGIKHPLTPQPLAPLHRAEAMMPIVGPMAADLEHRPLGEATGRGAVDIAQIAAPELLRAGPPLARRIAERTAGSMLGPEAENTLESVRPTPALVKEAPVALTRRSLIGKLGQRVSDYNRQVREVIVRSQAQPQPFAPIVTRASQPLIDLARANGEEARAVSLENWRDNVIQNRPESMSLQDVKGVMDDLSREKGIFKSGPNEDPTLKTAKEKLYNELNQTLETHIPGIRQWTQREGGLIGARRALESKQRMAEGEPLLPRPHVYVGEGMGGGAPLRFGGLRFSLGLPEGTLLKTLAVKLFGQREALPNLQPVRPGPNLQPVRPPSRMPLSPQLAARGIATPYRPGAEEVGARRPGVWPSEVEGLPLGEGYRRGFLPSNATPEEGTEFTPHEPPRFGGLAIQGERSPFSEAQKGITAKGRISEKGRRYFTSKRQFEK